MPAINLSRLKLQAGELGDTALQPEVFIRRLHDLLDFYADRTFHIGQGAENPPRLEAYRAPNQVLRQIRQELIPWASHYPQEMLTLADRLWQEEYLEIRLIAIHLFAEIPPHPPEPLVERVLAWAKPGEEPRILKELLASRQSRLQKEYPQIWLDLVQTWSNSHDPSIQGIGLQALLSIAQDENFSNFPVIFQNLAGFMQQTPSGLLPELLEVIACLARRTPVETAYVLRQALSLGPESSAPRIARRSLGFFPAEMQTSIRAALVENLQAHTPSAPAEPGANPDTDG